MGGRAASTSGERTQSVRPVRSQRVFWASLLLFTASASAQVQLPDFNAAEPISITAQAGNRWQAGSYEVWVLRGDCVIQQGDGTRRCREAVLWIDRAAATEQRPHKVIAYLEGAVRIAPDSRPGAGQLTDNAWLGRFYSSASVEVRAGQTAGKPDTLPEIYWRGIERRNPEAADAAPVQPAQFTSPVPPAAPSGVAPLLPPGSAVGVPAPALAPPAAPSVPATPPASVRRIRAFPRSNVGVQVRTWGPRGPGDNRWTVVIDSGVNVIVDTSATVPGMGEVGTIDISADRLVVWTAGRRSPT